MTCGFKAFNGNYMVALRQHKDVVPPSTFLGSPTIVLALAKSLENLKAFLVTIPN